MSRTVAADDRVASPGQRFLNAPAAPEALPLAYAIAINATILLGVTTGAETLTRLVAGTRDARRERLRRRRAS